MSQNKKKNRLIGIVGEVMFIDSIIIKRILSSVVFIGNTDLLSVNITTIKKKDGVLSAFYNYPVNESFCVFFFSGCVVWQGVACFNNNFICHLPLKDFCLGCLEVMSYHTILLLVRHNNMMMIAHRHNIQV